MRSDNRRGQVEGIIQIFGCFVLICYLVSLPAYGLSSIRVLNLLPDRSLEVWIDGRLVDSELDYLESSSYLSKSPGDHRVVAKPRNVDNPEVVNSKYPLRDEKEYTVIFTREEQDRGLESLFLIDNCPLSGNMAQIKFTDALIGSPPLDVSIKYGPTLYKNFSYLTNGGCVSVPPNEYTLVFTDSSSGERIFSKKLTLEGGYRYNLFLGGNLSEGTTLLHTLQSENKPEEAPKVFGIERSVLQLFGAGLIASLVILLLAQGGA